MFSRQQLDIIRYCSEECERQRSGELSVFSMLDAWEYAHGRYNEQKHKTPFVPLDVNLEFISHLGQLVEPEKNKVYKNSFSQFRSIQIFVGNGWEVTEKAPWERVPDLLTLLLESYYDGSLFAQDYENHPYKEYGINPLSRRAEDEFYFEYENIHPFVDGNGRTGKILYNYLLGTLENPVLPPNFWGSSNL